MSAAPEWVAEGQYLPRLRDLIQLGWGLHWFSRRYRSWEPRTVLLPGFDMLHTGQFVHFPEVCTPQVTGDVEDVVALYEEYVNRGLGHVHRPEVVLTKFFRDEAVGHRFTGSYRRRPTEWWSPLVKVMALASKVSGRQMEVSGWGPTGMSATLDLGGYLMVARHWGAFSNTKGTMHKASHNATDVGPSEFVVQRLFTDHPLAVAMVQLGAHREALQLTNLAIQADSMRSRPLLEPANLFAPVAARSPGRVSRVDEERIRTAEGFRGLLEESFTINELHEMLVPKLMSAREFRAVVGTANRSEAYRPTAAAAQRFEAYLDNLATRA